MLYAITGFLTGILGGLFGVGGGEIFIPVLIYAFGFSQHAAQGTSLAVLLPNVSQGEGPHRQTFRNPMEIVHSPLITEGRGTKLGNRGVNP